MIFLTIIPSAKPHRRTGPRNARNLFPNNTLRVLPDAPSAGKHPPRREHVYSNASLLHSNPEKLLDNLQGWGYKELD